MTIISTLKNENDIYFEIIVSSNTTVILKWMEYCFDKTKTIKFQKEKEIQTYKKPIKNIITTRKPTHEKKYNHNQIPLNLEKYHKHGKISFSQ